MLVCGANLPGGGIAAEVEKRCLEPIVDLVQCQLPLRRLNDGLSRREKRAVINRMSSVKSSISSLIMNSAIGNRQTGNCSPDLASTFTGESVLRLTPSPGSLWLKTQFEQLGAR